jgi:hypothetical protein
MVKNAFILSLHYLVLYFKKIIEKPGMVADACNPNFLGGEDKEDCTLRTVKAKSLQELISSNKIRPWWHAPVIPATQEAKQ